MTDRIDNWDSHWHEFGEAAHHNPATLYRCGLIVGTLGSLEPGTRLLDIGCGGGDLLEVLEQAYPKAELLGIDVAQAAVDRARELVPNAAVVRSDLLSEEPTDQRYSGWATHAVCSEVLEHVDDPVRLLRGARAYLASNCKFVVTVPSGPMSKFDRFIGHRNHFKPEQLKDILESGGFRVESLCRAGFPFFNVYRILVVLRGSRVIGDAASVDSPGGLLSRAVLRTFRWLFHLNMRSSRFGWQLIANVVPYREAPP